VEGFCEYGNKPSVSIKLWDVLASQEGLSSVELVMFTFCWRDARFGYFILVKPYDFPSRGVILNFSRPNYARKVHVTTQGTKVK
jgi:hypothetical protein